MVSYKAGKTIANFISLVIISMIFLGGCTNINSSTQTPTSTKELTATNTTTSIPEPTPTNTPEPTLTITPSPTPDPFGDPDGDGYITEFEKIWGTDPFSYTSFEELLELPGTIYAKMRVSQPFEVVDMNSTIYQVVRPIEVEDNGTPDKTSDDHLVFEVVLFPYAQFPSNEIKSKIESWPVDPEEYPKDIQKYLISFDDDVSNITDELRNTMLAIVNGTGEGYSAPAETDVEAIDRIMKWNLKHLSVDPKYETYYPKFREINSFRSGDMFESGKTRWCTTRATILNAELRAIGIPSAVFFNVSCVCNPNDDKDCDNRGNHSQNGVYLSGYWVLYDYNRVSPRSRPYYYYLIAVDKYRDNSEADFSYWYYIIDTNRIIYPFEELYYIYECDF